MTADEPGAGDSSATPATLRPGLVYGPEGSVDEPVAWHYGDPHKEQRDLVGVGAAVDLSHRAVVTVTGPDRLSWLNDLLSQKVDGLAVAGSALALILDPHGHVEFELHLTDDGETTWITTEPGAGGALATYLDSMRFMRRVEVAEVSGDYAVVFVGIADDSEPADSNRVVVRWRLPGEFQGTGVTPSGQDRGGSADKYVPTRPGVLVGCEIIVRREELDDFLSAQPALAGTWALEALRVAAGIPRMGLDTDHKTLPHEVGWIGPGVHLAKGCYRGQETVARVHNLGRPPRRMVLLHLDGSVEHLPAHGDPVMSGGRQIGVVGTVARHYELGPIATAIVKRNVDSAAAFEIVPTDDPTVVIAAAGEDIVTAG